MRISNDILANNVPLFSNKDNSISTHIAGYPLHVLSETEFSKSYAIRTKLAFKLRNIRKMLIGRK